MANDLKMEVILQAIDRATRPIRAVTQGSVGLGRALKESRDQLKQLQAQQNDVSSWQRLRAISANTETALQGARDKVKALSKDMAATGVPTKQMTEDLRDAIHAATDLKRKHQEQQVELQGLRGKLSAAGISTRNLSQHERDLRQRIEQTNLSIGEQTKRMQRLSQQARQAAAAKAQFEKAQQVAGGMAAGGAAGLASGYALAKPLKGMVDAFAPAENAATQLKVAMMDKNGQVAADFQRITELANGLGDRLPGTTADFQEMMTMLRRQGMSAQSILGGTGQAAAYLGVQLQKPVAEAAEFAAKMQDATRTSEKDMMGLMDTIQRAFYLGVDDNNMLQGFTKLSPVMGIIKKEGLDAANTLAPLLVMMDQTGMAGESAGNAIRKVFQSGVDEKRFTKANAALAEMKAGFDLNFTNGKGEFGGMDNLFAQLDKLKKLTSVQRTSVMKELFGDDSETLQVVNTLMNKGLAGYQEVADKMRNQADLQTRVKEQLGTLANTIEAAQGSWSNAMAEVGATVAPELKGLINDLGNVAVRIKEWVKENPGLTAAIFKTAAGLALLLTVGGGITLMLASMLGPFAVARYGLTLLGIKGMGLSSVLINLGKVALPLVWKGILLIGRALLMNPIGLAVTAIAAAAYLIYQNWEPIKAFFLGLWAEIKAGFNGGLTGILGLIANFSPIGLFYRAFAAVMNYFGFQLPGRFTEFGSLLMQGMAQGITNGLAVVKTFLLGIWAEIKAGFDGGLTGILGLIANFSPIGLFYRAFAAVMKYFGFDLPAKFTDFGSMLMQGMVQGITNGLAAVKGAITGAADSTVGWFKEKLGIHSPSRVFAELGGFTMQGLEQGLVGGQGGPLGAVTSMAKQLAAAGAVTLGMAGPALAMDNRAPLSPVPAAGARAAATALPPVTVNVYPSAGMNEQQLAQLVGQKVAEAMRASQIRNRSSLSDQE
ncbi:phage tail tape measure protein [Pseudomonas aeruginosa]|uniref:phage tail tape measure protein n=1 Tax=Pseudomonas aeruginosa TaxID=287 RepID=UPI0007C67355|nr:phage tail tape measure protein [Pseudomonas aeruginosa]KSG23145.2 phage tail tape measure protein [Pseudomonas aeruginosa]